MGYILNASKLAITKPLVATIDWTEVPGMPVIPSHSKGEGGRSGILSWLKDPGTDEG